MFKRCYALLKLDGTSCHISFNHHGLRFFTGCIKQATFEALFNKEELEGKFNELGYYKNPAVTTSTPITIFGEGFGGKVQGLSKRYGPDVRFCAFDVKVGDVWLSVPDAHDVCNKLGIEFVHYVECSTDLLELDRERDRDDEWALRNGYGNHPSEGIVIRPLKEFTTNDGRRVIAKHKKPESRETKTERKVVDPAHQLILDDAEQIASEYVVFERLKHVLQKVAVPLDTCNIPVIIKGMIEDVRLEAHDIVWSKEAEKAIGKHTAMLIKRALSEKLIQE